MRGIAIKLTIVLLTVVAVAGSAYYFCVYRPGRAGRVEVAYVLPTNVKLVDTPAEVRIAMGSLKSGDRVEIIKRTQNWAQVRTSDNLTGWVENKDLLDSQTYQGGQELLRDEHKIPVQADGHTSGVVNLRLEPSRDAAQLAQLPGNQRVQIFGRQVVDRPAPDGQPSAPKVRDAWYLINADARAGWVLGRFIALDIPASLAQYAEGTNLVAWVILKTVEDAGQQVPEFVVAGRLGTQDADFSQIRVFTWWVKNHRYVTAYVESGLNGYFPVRTSEVNGVPYFRLRLIDDQGQKYQKVYALFDTITRAVGTVPGWESEAMPMSPAALHHQASGRRRS